MIAIFITEMVILFKHVIIIIISDIYLKTSAEKRADLGYFLIIIMAIIIIMIIIILLLFLFRGIAQAYISLVGSLNHL